MYSSIIDTLPHASEMRKITENVVAFTNDKAYSNAFNFVLYEIIPRSKERAKEKFSHVYIEGVPYEIDKVIVKDILENSGYNVNILRFQTLLVKW